MSTEKFEKLEHRRLLQVAREYENKGYQVEVNPLEFPSFLRDQRPDLIARSEDDNVVVEVVSKQTISDKARLEELARSVEAVSGWRFEVVVTNPRVLPAEDIQLTEIQLRIRQAQNLATTENPIPALLTQWSAIEALLRMLASQEGADAKSLSSVRLVKTMYSLGVITRSVYELLEHAAQTRNFAAHGFMIEGPPSAEEVNHILFEIGEKFLSRVLQLSIPSRSEYTAEELVNWFFENFEDPAQGVPYEGGYIYVLGGPYDAWEELSAEFPNVDEIVIQAAFDEITQFGIDWVRRGQY